MPENNCFSSLIEKVVLMRVGRNQTSQCNVIELRKEGISIVRLGICSFYSVDLKLSFPHVFSGNLGCNGLWIPDKHVLVKTGKHSGMTKPIHANS